MLHFNDTQNSVVAQTLEGFQAVTPFREFTPDLPWNRNARELYFEEIKPADECEIQEWGGIRDD